MMKIVHTSDWHLGHTLYNYDRTEEQQSMLGQMRKIVSEEKPDVFLLCGDVYHTSQPSAMVQTMLTEALTEIHNANPGMAIVVTAGNHDSGTRHEIFREPWKAWNVHMTGNLDKNEPENHIIEIAGKGYIVAIPYVNERNMPEGFYQMVLDKVAERNKEELPVVMTAHTTVKGCDYAGHDHITGETIGGIDSTDISEMGNGYDYLALGHIHREQYVHTGKHNVRYSGSPIAISFDESYEHSVSIAEIERHGDKPQVRTREIVNPRPLVTLPTEGMAKWDEAKELLRNFPDDIAAYIRLNVEIEDYLPTEAYAEANIIAESKKCNVCHINAKRKTEAEQTNSHTMTIDELQAEDPAEIAQRYAEYVGYRFDDEMKALFAEAIERTKEEERNN